MTRTLRAVFAKSGVPGAHAHRFRHTLATEILDAGGSFEDAANILGNSPAVVRKHYWQWSSVQQARIKDLLQAVFGSGTFLAQTEKQPATDSFQGGKFGGRHGIRTHDPGVANAVLSQLSYSPTRPNCLQS